VADLISNAEMEQNDYRRGNSERVLRRGERYFGIKFGACLTFTQTVLIASTAWIACAATSDFAKNNWKSCEGVK